MPNWSRSRTDRGEGAGRVTPTGGFVDLEATADGGDVGRSREELRRTRLLRLVLWGGPVVAYLWYRIVVGEPLNVFDLPHVDPLLLMPAIFFVARRYPLEKGSLTRSLGMHFALFAVTLVAIDAGKTALTMIVPCASALSSSSVGSARRCPSGLMPPTT